MKTTKALLDYIATCSKTSLESFELARLNDRANLRKSIIELLDELIEVDIQARLAEWVLVQRRQQVELRRPPQSVQRAAGGRAASASLPLLRAHSERHEDAEHFPHLAENAVFPVLRDAAPDSPAHTQLRSNDANGNGIARSEAGTMPAARPPKPVSVNAATSRPRRIA